MGFNTPAGAANSVGNQQSSAVTGQTVTPQQQTALDTSFNNNPVNPAYWENQGFQVTQLVHGLQTATMAERAGASVDMVVASLFHDVGKMISNANHPAIAAEMIRPWVSAEAYWVVKVHQDFEGMHYYARMGLDPMVRRKYADHPHYGLAEQFADEWDQNAFDPDYPTLPLEHFEPMVHEVFGRPPRRG
jgi:predicted HD phosphohydrolase